MSLFAQVILPLPFDRTFTYCVPDDMAASMSVGSRVLVPFGSKKYYTAIVESLSNIKPQSSFELKSVAALIDSEPIIRHPQLKFWRWIADYYLSPIGDVYKAALPSGLKVESETMIEPATYCDPEDLALLTDEEREVFEIILKRNRISAKTIGSIAPIKNVEKSINTLIERGLIVISEKIVERFSRRMISYVSIDTPVDVTKLFNLVKGAKKQETALLAMLSMSEQGRRQVSLDSLLERSGVTRPIIKALEQKGILTVERKYISRFTASEMPDNKLPKLSEPQNEALIDIHHQLQEHNVCLLHGVTSSGKTEIYIHLIDYVMRQGNQALMLVPEIALTTQLTTRLQRVFGDKVIIYHSKFSDAERVEIWRRMLKDNEPLVVIGARSAVFLPFARIGLVIVDEEHETSYKQQDPSPRYNGRDAAIMLAHMHGAKTVLGSATPTIETYYKAKNGKYGLVSLTKRYDNVAMPEIEVVDLKKERQKGRIIGSFSQTTIDMSYRSLDAGKQVIFFHNRRGYAPMARCKACSFIPKCDHCDVSLTYHRTPEALVCHYCGASYPVMKTCPSCGEPAIEIIGYGTERVHDEVAGLFAGRRIMRMDLDTTRNKDSYARIVTDFSEHKADILIGTQMVTKGLDFADVDTVGVINADTLIHYPDFRASERAFNMLEQVAGRAGRRDTPGKVIIQTHEPSNAIIDFVCRHDYLGFYDFELAERREYNYPPFTRVINIYIKHRDFNVLNKFAQEYADRLRELLGNRVNGPKDPNVNRIQSMYIKAIMLKIEIEASMQRVKQLLRDLFVEMQSSPATKGFTIYYDVDPV